MHQRIYGRSLLWILLRSKCGLTFSSQIPCLRSVLGYLTMWWFLVPLCLKHCHCRTFRHRQCRKLNATSLLPLAAVAKLPSRLLVTMSQYDLAGLGSRLCRSFKLFADKEQFELKKPQSKKVDGCDPGLLWPVIEMMCLSSRSAVALFAWKPSVVVRCIALNSVPGFLTDS